MCRRSRLAQSGLHLAKGAGDDLHVEAAGEQLGDESFQLAITDQRIAADDGQMQRLEAIDDFENSINQDLALAIVEVAQGFAAAEVSVVESVAAGAAQRALAGDFDGEGGWLAFEDFAPSLKDFRGAHRDAPLRLVVRCAKRVGSSLL